MSVSRFSNLDNESIDEIIIKNTPENTVRSKRYIWKMFMEFCSIRKYELDGNRTTEELASILKDWAVNMRKRDGSEFKEATIKTVWNITSKLLQEKYYNDYNVIIDPFKSVIFKYARNARDATRKKLQTDPSKRKMASAPLSLSEFNRIINFWDENTPEGLQRKFYHIAAVELAWRGGEAVACLLEFFQLEKNNDGTPTNRVEYNPIFSKTCQGGSKNCTDSKYLVQNSDSNACPVRLYLKLLSKRGPQIKTNRLFLRPNRHWKKETDNWYDNMPLGRNVINGWTKASAEAIGLDTNLKKITNHSNRSTAVSHLAKSGVQEQQLLKITGHSNANSIKPYLNIDKEHHNKIINNMRGNMSTIMETTNTSSASNSNTFSFTNCSFNDCVFNK